MRPQLVLCSRGADTKIILVSAFIVRISILSRLNYNRSRCTQQRKQRRCRDVYSILRDCVKLRFFRDESFEGAPDAD
jgi:hypothetical protein